MAKILLGVSTVLIAVSAILGLMTKGRIGGLKEQVASNQALLATAENGRREAESKLEEVKKATEAAAAKADAAATELASVKSAADVGQRQVDTLKAQIDEKEKQITELNTKLAAANTQQAPAAPTTNPEDALKIKELETKLAEAEQVAQALKAKAENIENETKELREAEAKRQRQYVAKGLEGQIMAVNHAWNFVVLSLGDKQGVTPNAEMIIKRGDNMVGKVKITSVDPVTSIADVVPGSLAKGVKVEPGDRVIYVGS